MQTRHDSGGFTLIELLIVMVVIGILAAIAVPKLNVTKRRAYRSAMLSDLKALSHSQEVHHNINYSYSTDLDALDFESSEGVVVTVNAATARGWGATATHLGVATGQCGVFHGDAAASTGSPATTAGVVECNF